MIAVAAVAAGGAANGAEVYSIPEGERIYGGYAVAVDGVAAPVSEVRCSAMPFNRRWPGHQRQIEQTELCGMVRFAFDGKATVSVTADRDFREVKVRPLSRGIAVRRDGRTVTFDITCPGGYSVEFDGWHNNLHVFADANTKFQVPSSQFQVPSPGTDCQQQADNSKGSAIVFGPGAHDVGIMTLNSGDRVYIDPGAVVYGGFHAKHARDIRIIGRGIIDASKVKERILFEASGDGSVDCGNAERDYTIDFEDCRDFVIDGPVIRDSLAYNVSLWGCEDAEVKNVKIVGQWRYNTDGIDLRSCRRVKVSDCFARTFDDTFCFKCPAGGYGNCEDNVFERCVAWNDWGKAFEVGVGCRGEHMRRVTFRDCDCIHATCWAMDVTNVDDGRDSDILFEDIRVECDERMPQQQMQKNDESQFKTEFGPPLLFAGCIQFHHEYSGAKCGDRKAGFIDGVMLRNVRVTGANGRKPVVHLQAFDEAHRPENVVFEGLTIDGKPIIGPDVVDLWLAGPAIAPEFRAAPTAK